MLKKDDIIEIKIDDIGKNGEGIGKYNGLAVFVDYAVPDEICSVKITKRLNHYAVGKLIKVIEKSGERIDPDCPCYNKCGGCNLLHIRYGTQLKYKKKRVTDCLERIGCIVNPPVDDVIGMDEPMSYRNKARFAAGDSTGNTVLGYYGAGSHDFVKVENCRIVNPIHKTAIEVLNRFFSKYGISSYDEKKHKGFIRNVIIKYGMFTRQLMVIIVINGRDLPHKAKLIDEMKKIEELRSLYLNINMEKRSNTLSNQFINLWGSETISDYIGELEFKISPQSFYQVNPAQTEKLYKTIAELAGLTGDQTVLDAYCGVGTISLFLARMSRRVYGIEIVAEAVENAKINARINHIVNVEFYHGPVETTVDRLKEEGVKFDAAVIDPPRKGGGESFLNALTEIGCDKIIYVSCEPSALARDLKILCGGSGRYYVEKAVPIDMFPQTANIETVCLLKIKSD